MYGIRMEINPLTSRAESQNLDLEWASVWGAKCTEFLWKVKDFGCESSDTPRGIADFRLRVDLSMGGKMYGNLMEI